MKHIPQPRKYKSHLGIDRIDFETPERPRKEQDFDALQNDGIVYAHPRLLVISKKKTVTHIEQK